MFSIDLTAITIIAKKYSAKEIMLDFFYRQRNKYNEIVNC